MNATSTSTAAATAVPSFIESPFASRADYDTSVDGGAAAAGTDDGQYVRWRRAPAAVAPWRAARGVAVRACVHCARTYIYVSLYVAAAAG